LFIKVPLVFLVFLVGFLSVHAEQGSAKPKRIVVASGDRFVPLVYSNAQGKPEGILVDAWQLWSDKTGVEVEIRLMDWSRTLPSLMAGDVDAVDGVSYTPERSNFLDMSKPHTSVDTCIFFHETIGGIRKMNDLKGFPVGVLKGGHVEEHLLRNVPNIRTIPYENYEEMIRAAREGRLWVFVGADPTVPYYLAKDGLRSTFVRSRMPIFKDDIRVAVRKGNTELLALVEEGLDAITEGERNRIREQWSGVGLMSKIPWIWVMRAGGAGFIVFALFLLWNVQLRRRVSTATRHLVESEERFKGVSETANDAIVMTDSEGRISFWNSSAEEIFGYTKDEAMGRNAHSLLVPEQDLEKAQQAFLKFSKTGNRMLDIKPFELTARNKQGQELPIELSLSTIKNAGQWHAVAIIRDISKRKQAEEALQASEEKHRLLFENANDAISIAQDGMLTFSNPKTLQLTGYTWEELESLPFADLIHPEDREMIMDRHKRRLSGEKALPTTYSFRVVTKSGDELAVELNAVLVTWKGRPATLNFIRDITDQRRMEQQLQQAQKMESLGTLAGGIAHNFNNVLMGIQGRASLMMDHKDASHPDYEHLAGIEEYVRDATELTRDLLGFAMGGKYEVKPANLNAIIQHESRMFGRTKREIQIQATYEPDLWAVEVDLGQIRQMLLNLYVNAWQAMPGGGTLLVQTKNVTLPERLAHSFEVPPGRYVRLTLTDTGVGMDEAILPKIFDPFFTTREMGRGTGLGLASVYGIIRNHGGFIHVKSTKGQGSTFTIHLPASDRKAVVEDPEPGQEEILRGSGTVLLVDDEEMILDVGKGMLENLGYDVLVARSGQEALTLYDRHKEKIDLIILDMIMPKMSGGMTYDRLKKMDHRVRVILASGYSMSDEALEIMARGCNGFIQKPFNLRELSWKVKGIPGMEPQEGITTGSG